jgi:hypothetical protein
MAARGVGAGAGSGTGGVVVLGNTGAAGTGSVIGPETSRWGVIGATHWYTTCSALRTNGAEFMATHSRPKCKATAVASAGLDSRGMLMAGWAKGSCMKACAGSYSVVYT